MQDLSALLTIADYVEAARNGADDMLPSRACVLVGSQAEWRRDSEHTGTTASRRLGFIVTGSGFVLSPKSLVHPIVKDPARPFPDRVGIGRARGTDIVLPYDDVSKYHAFFSMVDGVATALTDAGSKNGTYIANTRLEKLVTSPLETGQVVAFGTHSFLFLEAHTFRATIAAQARHSQPPTRLKGGRLPL